MASASEKSSSSLCSVSEDQQEVSSTSADKRWEAATQLPVTISDTNDELVKQHTKLAEEAIAGWEKAEVEVVALKEKLEIALREKLAAEEKALLLDGALKECMEQFRNACEKQEQKIQDAVATKAKEWEKNRMDTETNLIETKGQLNHALAEKQAIEASFQLIVESEERKNRLLVVVERENAKFRNELLALGKEIDVCNKERQLSKKAEEASQKQNLESLKKIAKLEEECQRLRLLAKSRVLNQSKELEADLSSRKSSWRGSPFLRNIGSKQTEAVLDERGIAFELELRKEMKLMSGRLVSMEEETKSLKAQLAKKDKELKEARLLCSRATCKLFPDIEQHSDIISCQHSSMNSIGSIPLQRTRGSVVSTLSSDFKCNIASLPAEDAGHFVSKEPWLPATELSHTTQQKKNLATVDPLRQSMSFDELMNDFVEMEKLASFSPNKEEIRPCLVEVQKKDDIVQFSTVHENNTNKYHFIATTYVERGQSMFELVEACEGGVKLDKNVESQRCAEVDPETSVCMSYPDLDSSREESEFTALGAQLAAAVRNMLDIAEGIAQTDYTFAYPQWLQDSDSISDGGDNSSDGDSRKQWKHSGLNSCAESLVNLCNSLIQGKVDVIDFIAEVASALDWMVCLIFSLNTYSPEKSSSSQMHYHKSDEAVRNRSAADIFSARETSPTQLVQKEKHSNEVPPDQSSVSNLSFRFSETSIHEEETSKLVTENTALKAELEGETWKRDGLQNEILQLQFELCELEKDYKLAKEKLAEVNSQHEEANNNAQALTKELIVSKYDMAMVQSQLDDSLKKILSYEAMITALKSQNFTLESELFEAKGSAAVLERKILDFEQKLKEEVRSRENVEQQCLKLKQHSDLIDREDDTIRFSVNDAARLKKEQEMVAAAEKLAECQQTILALGKQLKALGAPMEVLDATLKVATTMESHSSSANTEIYSADRELLEHSKASHSNSTCDDDSDCDHEEPSASTTSSSWSERHTKNQALCSNKVRQSCQRANSMEEHLNSPHMQYRLQRQEGSKRSESYRKSGSSSVSVLQDDIIHGLGTASMSSVSSSSSSSSAAALEFGLSLPLRSPARFLSLRSSRNGHDLAEGPKHGDSDEKHGSSGFSRFFARTRRD